MSYLCVPLKKLSLFHFDWRSSKFHWANLTRRYITSGEMTLTCEMELLKDTRGISSTFYLVSLFLHSAELLSKWDTVISKLFEVTLVTVFFHTLPVTSLTIIFMQLKGGDSQGRQLRQMQLLHR